MTERTSDPLSWVTLDCWDVDPADLDAVGQPWDAVIPTDVDNRIEKSIGPLPQEGWREVAIQPDGASPSQDHLFAAPWREGRSLVHLSSPPAQGKPILSAGLEVTPRLGRPSRRHGLRLTWPARAAVRADELEGLQITLVNDGDVTWHPDPEDAQYVHAWLLDDDGERVGRDRIIHTGSQQDLHSSCPGRC